MFFMYRKIIEAEKKEDLTIQLPAQYLNKRVEVIAFELEEPSEKSGTKDFSDAIAFFDSIQVDMSDFKFNREEANER